MTTPISKRLKEVRTAQGMSKEKLARILDVSINSIWNWESGRCEPCASKIAAISVCFGVSADWLLGLPDIKG